MPPWGILGKCRDVIKWFADCIYLFITLIWKEGLKFWKGTFALHRGSYGTREKSFLGWRVHAKPLSRVTASCPSDAVMAICRGNENSNSFWLLLTTAPFVYLCCGGRSANLILVIFMAKKKSHSGFWCAQVMREGRRGMGGMWPLHPPEWIYRTCNLWSCQQAKWSATLWLLWVPGTSVLVALPSIKNIETHLLLRCWHKDK